MGYDPNIAAKVREVLGESGELDERKMFGGLAFMVKGYMCCGVLGDDLVLRLGPQGAEEALRKDHVRPMDFTGRPMKGYVFVAPLGFKTEKALRAWIRAATDFVGTLPPRG